MWEACGEARNSTAAAMSQGSPSRRIAMRSTSARWPASPLRSHCRSVSGLQRTKPGATALTVMPCWPSSCASWRTRPSCAGFAVAQLWMPVRLTPSPAPEEITTMRPARLRFITGITARAARKAPLTLTSWIASHAASLASSTGFGDCPRTPPATWTRMSGSPAVAISFGQASASVTSSRCRATEGGIAASFWTRMSVATTAAPRSPKAVAIAAPIPCAAPVPSTRWPPKLIASRPV